MMRLSRPLVVVALAWGLVCAAQAATVKIIVIDGKSGKVIEEVDHHAPAGLSLFDAQGQPIPIEINGPRQQGGERWDVRNATTVAVDADGYVDCRKIAKNREPHYSVDTIIKKGIVTENRCSKRTVAPVPGVIVLFVRKANWFESHWYE